MPVCKLFVFFQLFVLFSKVEKSPDFSTQHYRKYTLTYLYFVPTFSQICHLILLVGLYRTPVPWVAPVLAKAEAERVQKKDKAL